LATGAELASGVWGTYTVATDGGCSHVETPHD
jgi:hypothetical protein